MPPAISDDEASDAGDTLLPVTASNRAKSASKDRDASDDDEMLDVVGNGTNHKGPADDDDDDNEGEEEDLEEDEFIVEKIISHSIEANGELKFKVKWEGYEKKADQTWEDEDNLKENATQVLNEYLESVGGRDKIMDEGLAALKTKKRGRPSAGTAANGAKRRRNDDHPASSTPPASSARAWKPPGGSWEEDVESIDACHDENSGKLIVYLTWKNGQKTQHETKVIYQRCPQKMLQFYERHVKVVMAAGESLKEEHDARS
ncbi:heterochromatin protein one [Xylariaceae sp. FL1272]|nr:heterochromatin protein one [Xylariaceae sp. FL1272]